jgi:type I restriction enzyme R subunit
VPLDRKPTVPLDKLFKRISYGNRDPEVLSTIAGRLARLDRRLSKTDREELEKVAGQSISDITHALVKAVDPDEPARVAGEGADEKHVAAARKQLLDEAAAPLANNPAFRKRLLEVRRSYDQLIDQVSSDVLVGAGFSADATDRARSTVESFHEFIEEHRDEITALQVLYSRSQAQRVTYEQISELSTMIQRPPRQWTPEKLWQAYETLDQSKVYGSGRRILTDLVQLVRFALAQEDELVPFPEVVRERFDAWLVQQENAGRTFTPEQVAWLERIRDTIASSLDVTRDDFAYAPFAERGGLGKAFELFGEELDPLLDELTQELAA